MYALIKDGVVQNIIVADPGFIQQIAGNWDRIVVTTTAAIGWLDDGVNLTAPPAAPPPPVRIIAKVDYLKRMTQTERIAIRAAGATNATVNDYIELMDAATTINLDDPDTIAGLNDLEAAGIIAAGRSAAIRV